MNRSKLIGYKKKYKAFRHHAWAGLGFLSVIAIIRMIAPSLASYLDPILVILIIYIVVALLFTYRYRAGLSAEEVTIQIQPSAELEREKIHAQREQDRLKVEKKKIKAEIKKMKKQPR